MMTPERLNQIKNSDAFSTLIKRELEVEVDRLIEVTQHNLYDHLCDMKDFQEALILTASSEIKQVRAKLEIAVEALKYYGNSSTYDPKFANETLAKIKGEK